MKKSTKTITLICLFNLVITGLVLAQTSRSSTTSTTPVTPDETIVQLSPSGFSAYSGQPGPYLGEGRQLDDLLVKLTTTGVTAGETSIPQVIPSGQIGTEELLKINEDMNIMSQILKDNLQQSGIRKPIQGMFLQGYGALFMANVDFPLSAPPDVNAQKDQAKKDDTDRVWEQTRQQIYQPQTVGTSRRINTGLGATEVVRYDAQKVEKLKTTLIQSLKHASNIRALKADESVILSITGSGGPSSTSFRTNEDGRNYSEVRVLGARPTVLVIRAKKSDIDAFAKDELNLEQFSQRVQIISYPLLSGKTNVVTTGPTTTTTTRGRTTTSRTTRDTTTGGGTTATPQDTTTQHTTTQPVDGR